jgi:DNA-directed RNA polymerase subunit F
MALPLPRVPGPADVFGWTMRTASQAASVPGRVLDLLGAAEAVVARADELVDRTDKVITDAEAAVTHAQRVTTAAEEQVEAARPMIRFVEEFSTHEMEAAIKLVDELPKLREHISDDVLPILATLDRVGPDIHELLDVANDVRQAILGIPGFNFLRRRGEDKEADKADEGKGDEEGDKEDR